MFFLDQVGGTGTGPGTGMTGTGTGGTGTGSGSVTGGFGIQTQAPNTGFTGFSKQLYIKGYANYYLVPVKV